MPSFKQKIELLAPAGNFEKLETAIHYGADAVYLAGKDFSLRNFSGNFSIDEMVKAVAYAHAKDVKVYVACNIYPRTDEESAISNFLEQWCVGYFLLQKVQHSYRHHSLTYLDRKHKLQELDATCH